MIKNILFDLDGTLLPMDQDVFIKIYFGELAKKVAPLGYEPESLIKAVWAGTAAMVKNDGSCLNEEAFWKSFSSIYGDKVYDDIHVFDSFYSNEFSKAKAACSLDPKAATTVKLLKEKGYRLVLATNPIFPLVATKNRIRWNGLELEDFEYCTTYENSSFCKPNPKYYAEIMDKLGMDPAESLMVGNDVREDMVAKTLGMKVFLLPACILNKDNEDISVYPHGDFDDLIKYVDSLA